MLLKTIENIALTGSAIEGKCWDESIRSIKGLNELTEELNKIEYKWQWNVYYPKMLEVLKVNDMFQQLLLNLLVLKQIFITPTLILILQLNSI